MREVRLLQMARQQNIVHLLEAYRSQSGRLYLVFEYVERTLLQELKSTNKQGLSSALVKSISWQLLQSLSYLHRKKASARPTPPHTPTYPPLRPRMSPWMCRTSWPSRAGCLSCIANS